jgi:OFA family oxalate/formate antiporter-like MFS transporter
MMIAHFVIKKPEWYKESDTDNGFKLMSMWRKRKFRLIWFVVFINISCGLALISVASPIMVDREVNVATIALVVSVMGIFNGVGRLIFSAVSDRLKSRETIYLIILGLSIAVTVIARYANSNIAVYVALIIVSACYGAGFSCLPSLLSDIFGMDNISKIHGLSLTAWAMAGLVGNQISNLVHNNTGSYNPVFPVLTFLYAIALVAVIILRHLRQNEVKTDA